MRNFLLFIFAAFSNKSFSQVPMAMPPEADAFYNKAMPIIKPKLKKIIVDEAKLLKNSRPNGDSLFNALHSNAAFRGVIERDLRGIITLMMVQASKDADEDLKKMVISMRSNDTNAKLNKTSTLAMSDDEKKLQLQMIAQRKSEIAEEVSLVMKKISDNSDTIIDNLKQANSK